MEQIDTVAAAARMALSKHSGNAVMAARELGAMVDRDAKLKAALLEPLMQYACTQAVNKQIHENRDKSWTPRDIARTHVSDADRVSALAAGTLMMFPLPGGKMLGESKREDISIAVDFYHKQSVDMGHKARWLRLVSQSLPDGKSVAQVLNEKRLRDLQAEAREDA